MEEPIQLEGPVSLRVIHSSSPGTLSDVDIDALQARKERKISSAALRIFSSRGPGVKQKREHKQQGYFTALDSSGCKLKIAGNARGFLVINTINEKEVWLSSSL